MSETAACEAVVSKLKTALTLPDKRYIDVRPDGRPASIIGDRVFIAVFSEGQRFGSLDNAIDEYQKIGVTVSLKISEHHIDYWGAKINQSWEAGMSYAVRKILGALHKQPDIVGIANKLIETGISSPFIEMLAVTSIEQQKMQGLSWWNSSTTAKGQVNDTVGYSKTLHFEGLRRIQSMDSFT